MGQVLDHPHHAWRQDIGGRGQDVRQSGTQKALPLPHGNPALQQEGTNLIDDAGALADQSFAHAMERLQVELIGSLRRYELHRRPLHRLGDRLCIAEVVLLTLRIRTHVLRRHQPGVVAKPMELAAKMMRTDTGFHADEARRHVGEPRLYLTTRPLLPQHDRPARVEASDVERVLPDINADYGDRGIESLRHGVLLVFGAPCQLRTLAGQEHGRTIPLADAGPAIIVT